MRGDIVPPKRPEESRPPARAKRGNTPTDPTVSDDALPASSETSAKSAAQSNELPAVDLKVDQPPKEQVGLKRRAISKKTKILAAVGAVLLAGTLISAGLMLFYNQQLAPVKPGSDEKVKVIIAPGTDLSGIASELKKNDVIRSESAFLWYVRLQGKSGELQSGGYRLGKGEDVPKIVSHLTSGNTDTFSITFLPGATLSKHRQVLLDAGFSATDVDAALNKPYSGSLFDGKPASADLEGYIYGETYSFDASATPEQILQRTFEQYQSVIDAENLIPLYKSQGFNLYQGITLASIIQREVASPEDSAQVAQVFKLRLDRDMQLGSDVTYQYIADKTGQARSVDLDSPYNTRRYPGLPPGPIASPGLSALRAVAKPAAGDYVYFLSGDDDKTYFARTNEEHEKNIRDHCQKKCQII